MKYKRRIFLSLIIASLMLTICPAIAAESDDTPVETNDVSGTQRAEVTGYKYTYFDGIKYKRLWSYTYDRWIDPEWTPA